MLTFYGWTDIHSLMAGLLSNLCYRCTSLWTSCEAGCFTLSDQEDTTTNSHSSNLYSACTMNERFSSSTLGSQVLCANS